MDDLRDPSGGLRPSRLEWAHSAGPLPPRYQSEVALTLEAGPGGVHGACRRRRALEVQVWEGEVEPERHLALWRELLAVLPLGADLDLASSLRGRVGIAFNHLTLELDGRTARLDYAGSQASEDGDPRALGAVKAVRAFVDALPLAAPPPAAPPD